MHKVYFSLGSNLGDRLENLRLACKGLADHLDSLKTSPVYETEPWGYANQPAFLNMAAAANTSLAPQGLLDLIKHLELELGREPTFRYGPRKIDIDILFFGILVVNTPQLQIPHPRMAERAFVLVPLAELAPDHIHPILFRTINEMLASVDAKSVKFYQPFPMHPLHSSGWDQGKPMQIERFSAKLEAVGVHSAKTCVRIPLSVEHVFGIKGNVTVSATLNGVPFEGTMVMEGNGTHTMLLDDAILRGAGVKAGDTVQFTIQIKY